MTIPTYRELEDRIKVLEGKLEYWSGLNSFDEVKSKEWHGDWNEERMDIIGQNGNDGLHYNEDKEGM